MTTPPAPATDDLFIEHIHEAFKRLVGVEGYLFNAITYLDGLCDYRGTHAELAAMRELIAVGRETLARTKTAYVTETARFVAERNCRASPEPEGKSPM